MRALLAYWRQHPRCDASTGLYVWYDQMESGADDLVYSDVPSKHTPGWTVDEHGLRVAAPDLQVLMHREFRAFALFLRRWAEAAGLPEPAEAEEFEGAARDAATALQHLWVWRDEPAGDGYFAAYDVRARAHLDHRTYQLAWPLWEPGMVESPSQRDATIRAITASDMWTAFGVRSTSSADARYSNVNIIVPYSNWRGPVWPVQCGVIIAYALARSGQQALALQLGANIVSLLAADLRRTGGWHENYDSDTGLGLASPGFVSWTVCAADLIDNLHAGIDPFALD